ncbi:alpha-ketoacid dehydrogenase subunit beta [Natrarchaeobius sp. A-rgal3]|uniref:alpha-ketoacid dehydrogenase subunit beta n=1 Tax=Natrarchaeobius versutus TaxID=1679078 RepID=UPI00350F7F7C
MATTNSDADTQSLTIVESVRDGLLTEMAQDDDVIVLGEDVGKNGGVFRATDGLYEEFGEDRVVDTPLAESCIAGAAVGLAAHGMKPVPEMQFLGFSYPAFEQIINHAARLRSRSCGQYSCQMVIRTPYGGGIRAPEHHSESTETFFAHYPGLKVVVPSTPHDTKGLLTSAIRDPDPVVFLEPARLYRGFKDDVPEESYTVPIGDAAVRREGSDVSVFTWGSMTPPTLEAAENVEEDVSVEVVELRSLSPLDTETIANSVKKTGRSVVVHEAPKSVGLGAEITARIQEEAFLYLEAPVERITGFDVPFPLYSLEDFYLPEATRIEDGIRSVTGF